MYNQVSRILTQRASKSLNVVPTSYPAPKINYFAASILSNLQYMLILIVVMYADGLPEAIRENKMMVIMFIFFVGNTLSSTMTKTSAFEIYVGRKLIYSAMANHRMPNMQDLTTGLKSVGITLSGA